MSLAARGFLMVMALAPVLFAVPRLAVAAPADESHPGSAFTDAELTQFALFTAARVNSGSRGQVLTDALREKQKEIQKAHDVASASSDKPAGDQTKSAAAKKAPARNETLRQGLNDADLLSLARFTNAKLAATTEPKELGDSIRAEVLRLQATHASSSSSSASGNNPAANSPADTAGQAKKGGKSSKAGKAGKGGKGKPGR